MAKVSTMPLYEYTCNQCRRRFTVLVGMTAASDSQACPHCGHAEATRAMSRFVRGRGENDFGGTSLADESIEHSDDPRAMRRWAKEVSKELGEDLGDDFDDYMDAAEAEDEG